MKVVVAIDSFKGSMTSMQAGMACKEGILAAIPKADVVVRPLADGGEGTVTALVEGMNGTYEHVDVTGPMGQKVHATYGVLEDDTAVMEMAEASGITLVEGKPDPWKATSLGVGEMILDAVHKGCRNFIIGIGGSATTEGGIGMLSALGYEFYDEDDNILPPVFGSLARVKKIKDDKVPSELKQCHFKIACDVTNPLCTEQGCVYTVSYTHLAPGKEAREVYLPDGDWYDYYTGEKYSGGRYILANAPLDKVPVFIKAGAIIPVADGEIRSTEDITEDKISILTYPGKGSFVHYQDDNETFAYRNGAYNAVEYTLDGETLEKRVLHKGL